jgi:alkylhydroperoxidase family enzyme
MAHGAVLLRSKLFTTEQLLAITTDHRNAGLPPREVAMLDVVEKIVLHAYKVTPEDIDGLRDNGFSDEEIVDIVLTAAARSFFSKTLDALGAEPDDELVADPALAKSAEFDR